jgi:hypothetical protein
VSANRLNRFERVNGDLATLETFIGLFGLSIFSLLILAELNETNTSPCHLSPLASLQQGDLSCYHGLPYEIRMLCAVEGLMETTSQLSFYTKYRSSRFRT